MSKDRRKKDYFGFILHKRAIEFGGRKVSPVPKFGDMPLEIFYGKP